VHLNLHSDFFIFKQSLQIFAGTVLFSGCL
jgi:hypothetical protein